MLLLAIDFRSGGTSNRYVQDGWSEAETTHRWSLGRETTLRLPAFGEDCVLIINATPCRHPPRLVAQTVMLAVGDRLLGTVLWDALHVTAFRLPSCAPDTPLVLRFLHLNCDAPRAPDQMRHGAPLGLMLHSLRVFRADPGRACRNGRQACWMVGL